MLLPVFPIWLHRSFSTGRRKSVFIYLCIDLISCPWRKRICYLLLDLARRDAIFFVMMYTKDTWKFEKSKQKNDVNKQNLKKIQEQCSHIWLEISKRVIDMGGCLQCITGDCWMLGGAGDDESTQPDLVCFRFVIINLWNK